MRLPSIISDIKDTVVQLGDDLYEETVKAGESIYEKAHGNTKGNINRLTTEYNYNEHLPPPCEYYKTNKEDLGMCCSTPGIFCKKCDTKSMNEGKCIYSADSWKSEKMINDCLEFDSKQFKELMKYPDKNGEELGKNYCWVIYRLKELNLQEGQSIDESAKNAIKEKKEEIYASIRSWNRPDKLLSKTPLWTPDEVSSWFGDIIRTVNGTFAYKDLVLSDHNSHVRLGSRYFIKNGMKCINDDGKRVDAYNYINNIPSINQSLSTSMLKDVISLNLDYITNIGAPSVNDEGYPSCHNIQKPVGIFVPDEKNDCVSEKEGIAGIDPCIIMTRPTIKDISIIERFKDKDKNKICNCNFHLYGFFIALFIILLILNFFVFS